MTIEIIVCVSLLCKIEDGSKLFKDSFRLKEEIKIRHSLKIYILKTEHLTQILFLDLLLFKDDSKRFNLNC